MSATFPGLWEDLVRRVAAPAGRKGLRWRGATRAQDGGRQQHPWRLDSPGVPWNLAVGPGRTSDARLPAQLLTQQAGTQAINDHTGGPTFRGQAEAVGYGHLQGRKTGHQHAQPNRAPI